MPVKQSEDRSIKARSGNLWLEFLVSAVYLAAFNRFKVPDKLAKLMGYGGKEPMFKLDSSFNYSPDELYQILDDWGKEGRRAQFILYLTMDGLFPIVYTHFCNTAQISIAQNLSLVGSGWNKFRLLPLLTATTDYLENSTINLLILAYPQRLAVLARVANLFTKIKLISALLNLALLAGGGVVVLVKKARS
jgi:hypothetical protein